MVNSCDGIWNDSLDVRFTKKCDNNCSFCIEKTGIDSLGDTNIPEIIKNTKKSGKKNILILGGEPFTSPTLLLQYIKGIRDCVQNIYITTSLPKTIDTSNSLIKEILNLIDGLNVSLQHYDWNINNYVLRASSKHNRIEILKNLNEIIADRIRVSINLVNGNIDTKENCTIFFMR